jgi:uncharacterized MAPEG superfamily protein
MNSSISDKLTHLRTLISMTTDLICLVLLALWSIPLNHTPAIARVVKAGVAWGLSNRETSPDVSPWVERADRAQRNHHDNLAMIVAVVLTAYATGQQDGVTAIASIGILIFRVLHGVVYIVGWSVIRTLMYAGYIVSLLAIAIRVLV